VLARNLAKSTTNLAAAQENADKKPNKMSFVESCEMSAEKTSGAPTKQDAKVQTLQTSFVQRSFNYPPNKQQEHQQTRDT
jgi:hypothetical protein